MALKISPENFYKIRDPKNFHKAMRDDIELLRLRKAYVSLTTLLMCCLDALAAGTGKADRGKFTKFVRKHFPDLCEELGTACPGHRGADILYEEYRNGFVHLQGRFAIAENYELEGRWAGVVEVDGEGQLTAINIDRLAKEFLTLLFPVNGQ